jgi:hypothetical protein
VRPRNCGVQFELLVQFLAVCDTLLATYICFEMLRAPASLMLLCLGECTVLQQHQLQKTCPWGCPSSLLAYMTNAMPETPKQTALCRPIQVMC